jgi:hypothetical protein
MDCFVAALLAMTPQLRSTAPTIPINVNTNPATSIGTRLLPEYGFADTLSVTTRAWLFIAPLPLRYA